MNENAVDILASYNLTAQVSLDGKTYFVTQADAANFGENNNKALSYYDGMFIYCAQNRTYYVWNERKAGEERSQLLENDFTYPENIETNGIVYSGKIYNFFKFLPNAQEPIVELRRFIVNSKYEGDEELGSILKPFKTLDGAYDAVLEALADPDISFSILNYSIEVEKGDGAYVFTKNYNLLMIPLIIKEGATVISIPSDDDPWFCNMDSLPVFNGQYRSYFVMEQNSTLIFTKNGFSNSGNNSGIVRELNGKTIYLDLQPTSRILSSKNIFSENRDEFVMFGLNLGNQNLNNDNCPLIEIKNGHIESQVERILEINKGIIKIENTKFVFGLPYRAVDADMPIFNIKNGAKFYSNGISVSNVSTSKIYSFFLVSGMNSVLNLISPIFNGIVSKIVDVTGESILNNDPFVTILNSTYFDKIECDHVLKYNKDEGLDELYQKAYINNCTFSKGQFNLQEIDMTGGNKRSCLNYVGNLNDGSPRIIKHLVKFPDRESALNLMTGVGEYVEFINTNFGSIDSSEWFIDLSIPIL